MTTWSKEQEQAIYTTGHNILVSASAGSGKTTVLIARLLNLVQKERVNIDRILAMTFTEAAANEMKKRLSEALQKAIQEEQTPFEEKVYLQQQLANMSKAYISTIHGFCLRIIENYYYLIGLDKARTKNILDDATRTLLLKESMDEAFAQYANHPTMIDLLSTFSARADNNQILRESLLKLFYLANSKSDPNEFLMHCKGRNVQTILDYQQEVKEYFFDYLSVQIAQIIDKVEIRKQVDDGEQLEILHEKMEQLLLCQALLRQQNYPSFKDAFFKQSLLLIKKMKDHDESAQLKKEIESLEESLHAILFDEETYIKHTQANQPLLSLLSDLCISMRAAYALKKQQVRGIDFDDMEQFALRILQAENGYIAEYYKNHFYEIMVDEFQDSNDVQDELVSLICKKNNVFRVGDIKQSIYGFRHASPAIMKGIMKRKGKYDQIIYLSSNYRSKKKIVDFNNHLYTKIMNVKGFSKAFSHHDATQTGLEAQEKDNCPIEMHLIDDVSINENVFQKQSKDQMKASYIVHKMLELREKRGYAFKDFVILIRQNDKANVLKEVFDEMRIPYFINMKDGFYHSPAIIHVSTFLKALVNPHDDLIFCALLLSPFFHFCDDDLAQAKLNKQQSSFFTYFDTHYDLRAFKDIYTSASQLQMNDLLQAIMYTNHYYFDYTNAQEKSNLDKLLELIHQQQSKQAFTLDDLIAFIDENKDTKVGEAIPIGLQDDVVRVMSIHQSKGLQFPVVFLYSKPNISISDTTGIVALDATMHIGMQHIDLKNRLSYPTIERIAINHKITKDALQEEMRILYVATTRAQNEMYIVDCLKAREVYPLNVTEIYQNSGYTKWILQAYPLSNPFLFKIIRVDKQWKMNPLTQAITTKRERKNYSYEFESLESLAPSDSEVFSFTPATFQLNEDQYMQRGTNLHKMVECMQQQVVETHHLYELASALQISLTKQDEIALLALFNNPIYLSSQSMACHHEFAFMTKANNRLIHGYMDYVAYDDTSLIMIDFKSDRNVTKEDLLMRYEKQIDTYYEALCILFPNHTIQTYIYSFSLQKMITIHTTKKNS